MAQVHHVVQTTKNVIAVIVDWAIIPMTCTLRLACVTIQQ